MEALIAWLVALMIAQSPPDRGALAGKHVPDAVETTEQRVERYHGIATALATVVFDPTTKPAFGGKTGRHATATLLLGLSWMESGWRRDVDLGLGKKARGGGTDSCLMQIKLNKDEVTHEGWTWQELTADREKCFRSALRIVRRSMAACAHLPVEQRLAAYATGSCHFPAGHQKSEARFAVHRRLFDRLPKPPLPQPPAQGSTPDAAGVAARSAP